MSSSGNKELFSRPQIVILLVLVCLLGGGLFLLKHRGRLGSSMVAVEPGNPGDYAFRISINTASWEEISLLPGIGPVKAKAIVSFRGENGPFAGAEDLTAVDGIGEKTVSTIAEYLVFEERHE